MNGKESINPSDIIAVSGCGKKRSFPHLEKGTDINTVRCGSFKSSGMFNRGAPLDITVIDKIGYCQNPHCRFSQTGNSVANLNTIVPE